MCGIAGYLNIFSCFVPEKQRINILLIIKSLLVISNGIWDLNCIFDGADHYLLASIIKLWPRLSHAPGPLLYFVSSLLSHFYIHVI